MTTLQDQPAQASRRFSVVLLLAYTAFVVYGSLVPLDVHPLPMAEAWQRFSRLPFTNFDVPSRTDWAVNLLLLVPMAFMAQAVLAREPVSVAHRVGSMLVVAAGCAMFAFAIEFTQVFFPGRTMSAHDIQAQILGSWVGLGLHWHWGRPVGEWLAAWWGAERGRALATRVLHAYLVGYLLFALMPLDLTISPVELWQKWRQGRVSLLPFADLPSSPIAASYELLVDAVLWLPVGLVWALEGRRPAAAAWRGLAVAACIELAQLLVFSRNSSSSDVIVAVGGSWAGAWLGWRLARPAAQRALPAPTMTDVGSWLWAGAACAWALILLVAFWYPYDFIASRAQLEAGLAGLTRPPLQTYYQATELSALNEILRKVLMFLPLGLMWSLHLCTLPPSRRSLQRWLGRGAALGLALLVEAGQLALPGKVADLTDAALETAGAWLGLSLGWRLFAPTLGAPAAGAPPVHAEPAKGPVPQAPAEVRRPPVWLDAALVGLLALLLWRLGRLPQVPYNVRELFPSGPAGLAIAMVLAAACWWLVGLPLLLAALWRRQPERAMWLVPALPVLGLVGGLALLAAVPEESMADIVGSPVLGLPGWLETLGRYMALHGALALAILGGVWTVGALRWRRLHGLVPRWCVAVVLWALPLHGVVVWAAATDNLTELMRGGGGVVASACLFLGVLALFVGASAAAAALSVPGRRWRLVLASLSAWPVAAWLLWQGSEPLVMKYGKVFSAAQFLLSADRGHYVGGLALVQRFLFACVALAALTCLMQAPQWRRLSADLDSTRAPRP